jgi:hypothetical protein
MIYSRRPLSKHHARPQLTGYLLDGFANES